MKVLLINKFEDTGGAAIASKRLYEALKQNGVDVDFLVQDSQTELSVKATKTKIGKWINFFLFSFERLKIYLNIKDKKDLFAFDSATFGKHISRNPLIQQADIIHLHWINFGFLSIKSIEKLLALNKPVFWTFHDMWPLTGGCFHSRGCDEYTVKCTMCPYLRNCSQIAKNVFDKKYRLFRNSNLYPVAISSWMTKLLSESAIFSKSQYFNVSNPIDTDFFSPIDKKEAKLKLSWSLDRVYIGFIAYNTTNFHKGGSYLADSIHQLINEDPQLASKITLVAIGKASKESFFPKSLDVIYTGYIKEQNMMLNYYQAMDLFIQPSLEESLSLVIQEAMACGTPVVAFNTGGIPDLVEHNVTGYLAEYKDADDLKNGIVQIITDRDKQEYLIANARKKIVENFSYQVIAKKMIEIYKTVEKE